MNRVGYVIVFVSDLTASIAFYRDVLGLPFKFEEAGYAEFATEETRFALYERRRAEWLTAGPVVPGPAHLADPDGFVVELAQEIPRRRLRAR